MSEAKKIVELKDEELEKVSGGSQPNTLEQGSKYTEKTQVKFYVLGCIQTIGIIEKVNWNYSVNQFVYEIKYGLTRYITPDGQVDWLQHGTAQVNEEDIIYDL